MLPEELARIKIDKQLKDVGWDIISRDEYVPQSSLAVKEALMKGNRESDYLLFVDNKAIAVVEAKKESDNLGENVAKQAENYSKTPQSWYGLWFPNCIPLVYLANGEKIYFKNMITNPEGEYEELSEMHSPKKMLKLIGKISEFGALPRIEKNGLRDCQYNAEVSLENSFKNGDKKALAVLATGSGKTYLACLASYRLLNYTSTKRILFLVDRNNLARQAETEFSLFDRTEKQQTMNFLYQVNRLKKNDDINGDIIISTIQKLFSVLTGRTISDNDEDMEDELINEQEDNEEIIQLGNNLKLSPNFFQFIIIDECHRSIYGKWKSVLDYFKGAKILGLTATPTLEAYAFFNNNIIENYTYEESVIDGVNVPPRIYRIITEATIHGGTIEKNEQVTYTLRRLNTEYSYAVEDRVDYSSAQLDRSVINLNQIETVIKCYRDAIFTALYPDRTEDWRYIPKTLIFAKDDNHANQIVNVVKKVFAEKFPEGIIPNNFVQKITYSTGDSNALIRDLRTEREFRIAITVTLVATGTDVKPLEVVLFMKDVKSEILYTQMKGRGCRVINDDKLREITPNAQAKECFYIVDAVGVTEHDKNIPKLTPSGTIKPKILMLEQLLEHLAHNDVSDENLALLRDYCSSINRRYEDNPLFIKHLDSFIMSYGYAPRTLANSINSALSEGTLPTFNDVSDDNSIRMDLISCLITNIDARKKLLELQIGYYAIAPNKSDEVIYSGFSKETAQSFIDAFEKYLNDNTDYIEALRIIYNSEDAVITYSMLNDLRDKLQAENRMYTPFNIWNNYKLIDFDGSVEEFDIKHNLNALTHLIQLARYAFHKTRNLKSLFVGYSQRFNLYCGQAQRELDDNQKIIMKQIADYIINEGSINVMELNAIDTDLWRKAIASFGKNALVTEIQQLSKFILKVA